MTAIQNLGNKSATIDFLRKNDPRGDKIDLDDYGVDYGGIKKIPRIDNLNASDQAIQIQVSNGLIYIIKGLEIIIEYTANQPLLQDNGSGGAKLTILYPETESSVSVSTKSIEIDVENDELLGLLHICDTIGNSKWEIKDYSTELGKKYIFAFLNLNYVHLDSDQSTVSQKQIKIQTNSTVSINIGTVIYFKPIGWKLLKTNY